MPLQFLSDEPEVCAEEGTGTPAVVKPEGGASTVSSTV